VTKPTFEKGQLFEIYFDRLVGCLKNSLVCISDLDFATFIRLIFRFYDLEKVISIEELTMFAGISLGSFNNYFLLMIAFFL